MRAATLLRALLIGALLGVVVPRAALADEAEDSFRAAQDAEARFDFAPALAGYERAVALRPSASFALRARTRAEDLRAHAEGDFLPLAALERVRRVPGRASDPEALATLYRDAQAFPPGRVRSESFLLVADAYARRVHDPVKALPPALALLDDASVERTTRSLALGIAVDAELAMADKAGARRLARAHRELSPALAKRLDQEKRRDGLVLGAEATVGAVLLAGALAAVRVGRRDGAAALGRRAWSPVTLLVAALIAVVGAGLARHYDETITTRPFVLFAVGVAAIDRAVALVRAAMGTGRGARAVAATSGLLAVAMAAILALAWSDPAFIESFGL